MRRSIDELERYLIEQLGTTTPEAWARGVVVCPSLSFPVPELRKIVGIEHYEERLLFTALLLRDPHLQVLYPTSVPVDAAVLDYYLGWLPDPAGARARLHLFPLDDPTPGPLTAKLLARPDVLAAIREAVGDPARTFVLPFNVTDAEGRLAEALGLPLYAPHPDLIPLGSKSGARHVARAAGVPVFAGAEDLHSFAAIESALEDILAERPDASAAVAKLNNGFSGQGNLVLDLLAPRAPLTELPARFCAAEETWVSYREKVEREGAIVEELCRHPGLTSPSVQVRVLPGGRHEVVSTHDQILGGPDGQVYIGCRFPADDAYRATIVDAAGRVAGVLGQRGVIGSFGIDFVVVPDDGVYLSEINLRLGGTTHPFLMARYVTGGVLDPASGRLLVDGVPRVYKASDNEKSERYRGLRPGAVIEAVARAGLAYDPATRTGATLHLLGAITRYGKWGLVCIASDHGEADLLYERVVACVDALAGA
jgi:hypothetical protein